MKYLSVKSWANYQHYKDRDPPWVKLYRDTLSSESWVLGTDLSRLVQVASVLLAARYSNQIPYRWDLIKKVTSLDCDEQAFSSAIDHLVAINFLEIHDLAAQRLQSASTPQASCAKTSTVLYSEERREEKRESRDRGEHIRASASTMLATSREPDADDLGFARVKAAYPKFSGRQDWISTEHHCVIRIDQDGETWDTLTASAERYARWCDHEKRTGTTKVLSPVNFFSGADKPWKQGWEIPASPAQERETRERSELQDLMDSRAELGLSSFRNPHPHESADAYRTQLNIARNQRGSPSVVADLAAAKRMPK